MFFSKTAIQICCLKANGCNKIKWTKTFPVTQQGGSGPCAACDTGLPSSIPGERAGSELPPSQGALAFGVTSLPLAPPRSAWHTAGTARGPQEGGSHRKTDGRSSLLTLHTDGKICLNN